MADDRYSLAEARAIIDAEKCERQEHDTWCMTHDTRWSGPWDTCPDYPEVVDVAAQLLATVEQVQVLLDEADRWKPYPSRDIGDAYPAESVTDFWGEVRAAINGEEVTK